MNRIFIGHTPLSSFLWIIVLFMTSILNAQVSTVQISGRDVFGRWGYGPPGWKFIFIINGDVTVPTGKSLEILSGTRVKFKPDKKMTVVGTLEVEGETGSAITFSLYGDPASQQWGSLEFLPGNAQWDGRSVLRHCGISDAGTGIRLNDWSTVAANNQITLSHVEISDCNTGINFNKSHRNTAPFSPVLDNLSLLDNREGIIFSTQLSQPPIDSYPTLRHCVIAGNTKVGLQFDGNAHFHLLLVNSSVADNGTDWLRDYYFSDATSGVTLANTLTVETRRSMPPVGPISHVVVTAVSSDGQHTHSDTTGSDGIAVLDIQVEQTTLSGTVQMDTIYSVEAKFPSDTTRGPKTVNMAAPQTVLFYIDKNQPPTAIASTAPGVPTVGTLVQFDGRLSYDPDGDIVAYRWDFDKSNGVGVEAMRAAVNKLEFDTYSFAAVVYPGVSEQSLLGTKNKMYTAYYSGGTDCDLDGDGTPDIPGFITIAEKDPMGTRAHEVGHALGHVLQGTPTEDRYSNAGHGEINQWGLMGTGCHGGPFWELGQKPNHTCAFSKQYLGWLQYHQTGFGIPDLSYLTRTRLHGNAYVYVADDMGGVNVQAATSGKASGRANDKYRYFIIEARNPENRDTDLPDLNVPAMVVYKVDGRRMMPENIIIGMPM